MSKDACMESLLRRIFSYRDNDRFRAATANDLRMSMWVSFGLGAIAEVFVLSVGPNWFWLAFLVSFIIFRQGMCWFVNRRAIIRLRKYRKIKL